MTEKETGPRGEDQTQRKAVHHDGSNQPQMDFYWRNRRAMTPESYRTMAKDARCSPKREATDPGAVFFAGGLLTNRARRRCVTPERSSRRHPENGPEHEQDLRTIETRGRIAVLNTRNSEASP
jgi:hypothetical protein